MSDLKNAILEVVYGSEINDQFYISIRKDSRELNIKIRSSFIHPDVESKLYYIGGISNIKFDETCVSFNAKNNIEKPFGIDQEGSIKLVNSHHQILINYLLQHISCFYVSTATLNVNSNDSDLFISF